MTSCKIYGIRDGGFPGRIYEEFEKRKIGFAYPTQTLYLTKT